MLTGHIVDGLTTQIAPHVWNKLTPQEKKIFTEVTREAAARATDEIKKREAELADEFKKKGLQIVAVDRKSFVRRRAEEHARWSRWASPSPTTTRSSRSSDASRP